MANLILEFHSAFPLVYFNSKGIFIKQLGMYVIIILWQRKNLCPWILIKAANFNCPILIQQTIESYKFVKISPNCSICSRTSQCLRFVGFLISLQVRRFSLNRYLSTTTTAVAASTPSTAALSSTLSLAVFLALHAPVLEPEKTKKNCKTKNNHQI